jgi:alpha/beta superfamily hydrolase
MAQPVVYRCAQSCRARGMVSLRFNFRGVGRSEGVFSGWDEYRDVVAAAEYLQAQMAATLPGSRLPVALVGYSFGSVMAVISLSELQPDGLVLIGFPVASDLLHEEALERLRGFNKPLLVVVGEADDFAPLALLQRTLDRTSVPYRLEIVRGTGHFFEGRQREVAETVASFLAESVIRQGGPPSD